MNAARPPEGRRGLRPPSTLHWPRMVLPAPTVMMLGVPWLSQKRVDQRVYEDVEPAALDKLFHGVTATCKISRLTCRTTKKTYSVSNQIARTQKKSHAHIFDSCRFRNSRHPGDGPRLWRRHMYLATVLAETLNRNLTSSAWIRFWPQSRFSAVIRRMGHDLVELVFQCCCYASVQLLSSTPQ